MLLKPGRPLLAYAFDPASKQVRNASRLDKVVLVRFAEADLDADTQKRAAGGVLAFSAICTHQACDVKTWIAKDKSLVCFCHSSKFLLLKINFLDAHMYVHNDVFTSIDKKTGRPSYDAAKTPGPDKAVKFCPSLWGGKDWPPEAYNPKTGLFYIPANNNLCSKLPAADKEVKYKKGDLFIGYPIDGVLGSLRWKDKEAPKTIGEIQAWNLSTGKQVWTHKFPTHMWGPLLTTGGNLLFAGGTNDRMFRAFDATTGKVLWEANTPSGITGVPSSFEIDGVQYIAVQSGWGVDAQRMQNGVDALLDAKHAVPQGGVVMVYTLGK